MQNHDHTAEGASADADLILRTRSGDADAFGELWQRHYPSGMSVARSITSSIDPDDLVQEAYARIYQAIIKGGGPNGSFRAYLFTSIRNTAAAWGRSRRETAMDELETVADPNSTDQAADEALDRSLTAQAFRGLPTRWQEVLWYIEIEQMKPAEVAPLLGMRAGAVSQLAFRAREGLREAWIQAHLRSAEPGSPCQWTIEHVGAYSRGNLSSRDQKRLEQHIEDCARCTIVVAEAKDVSNRLALVLLPLVLGISGAAGYTATLQAGGAPVVALAAMPSSVIDGGVVVGGAGTSGAPGAPAGSGGTGNGAVGGSGATGSSATGAVTGIGALVGAGSAALVVAGVVAAATIVPGLLEASPVTSMPSASEAGDSSISTELEPGSEMNDEKFILEIPEKKPKKPDDVDQAPEVKKPVNDSAPTVEAAPPAAPVAPAVPGDGSGGDGDEGTTEPVDPVDRGDGGNPDPGNGGDDGDPDPTDPPPAVLPEGTPTVSSATATCVPSDGLLDKTVVTVALSGAPNASVKVNMVALETDVFETELGVDGVGSIELSPTALQLLGSVTVSYIAGDQEGPSSDSTRFSDLIDIGQCLPGHADAEPGVTTELGSAESAPAAAEEPLPAQDSLTEPVADTPAPEAGAAAETSAAEEPVAVEESAAAEESAVAEAPVTANETATAIVAAPAPAEDAAPAE
ncbi:MULTISPECIES: sigma-70 family RNA polymerase sigma factor [Microbacterium]|uniref:sigma-70 family RNA polymerase sigma factor n=1 Tax=Microbacterium TaxID=33882 RepID=UPI00068B59D0|nr:sigma-70 family RNA polymerase sigma factor [Microbacterium profundi]